MGFMETSLMVNDYPETNYNNERTIKAKIFVSYDLDVDVPVDWDEDKIADYIRENFNDFTNLCDENIDDVEIAYF